MPANTKVDDASPVAAFFDVDGTLVRGHMLVPMMRLFYRWGYLTPRDLAKTLYRRALFASGRMTQRDVDRMWSDTLAFLKGRRRDDFAAIMARAFAAAPPRIRPGVGMLIEEHRRLGHRLYLATSQTIEAAKPLADSLAMDGVVGTELEIDGGSYTGRFVRGYCYGDRKAAEVEAFCDANGIDLDRSWFYTDSSVDVPLLKRVGHPVVVNPDRALSRVAAVKGWRRLAFA
jgi:putative phosphoserine phosphatase/1-acylglycerol-3-phosphate O-acyltransferase